MQRWMHVWEAYDGLWACSACSGFSVLQISSICTKCTQSGSSDFFSMEASMHGATLLSRMLPVLSSPPTIQRLPSKSGLKPEPANPFGDIWSMNPGVQVTTSGDSSGIAAIWGYGFASLRKDGGLQGQNLASFSVEIKGALLSNWVWTWKWGILYSQWNIAIFHRDNDQQNHWVQWGTQHFQTNPIQNTSCRSKSTNICAHLSCP